MDLLTRGTTIGFTVSIEDVTHPARFSRLADALIALWGSLRELPLGATQADAYQVYLTGPEAEQRVAEQLESCGAIALTFEMAGRSHLVEIVADSSKRFPWTVPS
ncbi:hypothetical protein [Kitasatospora sp. P5_F3]